MVVKENPFARPMRKIAAASRLRGEAERLEHVPLRKMTFDLVDVASEALQDFGNDHARKGKGFCIGYHPAQLSSSATRRGTEEVGPKQRYRPESNAISPSQLVVPFPDTTAMVMKNAYTPILTELVYPSPHLTLGDI